VGGLIYHICALILIVIIGREVEEDFREKRTTKAWIGIACIGVVIVMDLLFGFNLLWKMRRMLV